jgi:hypothetical protein
LKAGESGQRVEINDAIFHLMMMTNDLFFFFKIEFVSKTDYRQQIKTIRLKCEFF